ncbi:MAG: hypothetical protein N2508_06330 [Anaerolineae bacterium]|nr:hypothetical protein [Anaerolineae bacterium]
MSPSPGRRGRRQCWVGGNAGWATALPGGRRHYRVGDGTAVAHTYYWG